MKMKNKETEKKIYVYADWDKLNGPELMGILNVSITRGKEVFAFEYDKDWLHSAPAQLLDPDLGFYSGPQFLSEGKSNFGLFLDSAPDRWGRLLMKRREALKARKEERPVRILYESDYLLGVFDGHRMGALRFKLDPDGEFLDNDTIHASPPWTKLRDLEYASSIVEDEGDYEDPEYSECLRFLMVPGSSLGGARPKSSVVDPDKELWIAKFPSKTDQIDVGAWEMLVHELARRSGIRVPESRIEKFSGRFHTYLSKRFDRTRGTRIHFASALTMLGYSDGTGFSEGASYLEIAEFLMQSGANVPEDLEELWKRIVFNICVSNTDDHLRNHGFILTPEGWILSPAYDMNPEHKASGLSINISEDDNSRDLNLAREVAEYFRIGTKKSDQLISQITSVVKQWRSIAKNLGIAKSEQEIMSGAFDRANM
jgi:serine/threonine-protein kinase HipA